MYVIAGSFTAAKIINRGSGYRAGDVCLVGNTSSGTGFKGTFAVDSINGSLTAISIDNYGSDYNISAITFETCFSNTVIPQVRISMLCS